MTPEQHVEEYRKEFLRHSYADSYEELLASFILRDGLAAVPYLITIIDQYEPGQPGALGKERAAAAYGAQGLLTQLDENVVRLRGSVDGRGAIEALRRLVDRMRAAHFENAAGDDYWKQMRLKGTRAVLTFMDGINMCDTAVQETLARKYGIQLTDDELRDFIASLVSEEPRYPSWSEKEQLKDPSKRSEAGYPVWYIVLKKPEPIHQAYVRFKQKSKSK